MILNNKLPKKKIFERDNIWLLARLNDLWSNFFPDIKQINPVFIKFGRHSRFRLGSIRFDRATGHSHIIITSMFKDENIPQEIIDHTIAHELCHYTHGFSSPNPKLHRYPHYGGIIRKELENRGLYHLVKVYALWLKKYRKRLAPS